MKATVTATTRALLLVGLCAVLLTLTTMPATAADDAQELFVANKCNNCHSIEALGVERKLDSEKMKGPDMAGVGDRHEVAWMKQFVMKEVDLDGKKHLNNYKGSEKDLDAILAWLAKMKAE